MSALKCSKVRKVPCLAAEIDPVEAFEVLEPIESVVIGDVEACRKKMERYAEVGCDRLMCLMQMGGIAHETVMESIRIVGEELVPKLAG